MKKMRRLIPAIAMLLVSAVMLSTASFAWFTISTSAQAVGMNVTATASSSLLITDGTTLDKWTAATGTVDLKNQNITTSLTPATHDGSKDAEGKAVYASGLKVVAEPEKVNPATGAYEGTYSNAAPTTNYIDYVVYIGTTGQAMPADYLNAQISITDALTYELHNAVSVDFLVEGNYAGTMNLKSANNTNKNYNIDIAQNLTIPVSIEVDEDGTPSITNSYITITMRVYFDGALETSTAGTYYVRNTTATTEGIGFAVNFAVNKAASANENASMYVVPTPSN